MVDRQVPGTQGPGTQGPTESTIGQADGIFLRIPMASPSVLSVSDYRP